MSAIKLNSVRARLNRIVPLRRFVRRQDGAAAIEFGLVMLPFLMLMFLIMETALLFFAGQTLETAVADSARLIKTGQAQSFSEATFKTEVCKRIYALFDCSSGMYVDVRDYTSFASISNTVQTDPATGNPITQFSTGALATGQIAVVRLMYKWPILFPLTQKFLGDSGGTSRLLVATAAFRNEPF
jgi:Flp pilus assembly protein TadG